MPEIEHHDFTATAQRPAFTTADIYLPGAGRVTLFLPHMCRLSVSQEADPDAPLSPAEIMAQQEDAAQLIQLAAD